MPCIIEKNECTNGGSLWISFCGKNVWRDNQPFLSIRDALMGFKPVCKKCRRLSKMDNKDG